MTIATGFTNEGVIELTNNGGPFDPFEDRHAAMHVLNGTLTNVGTIRTSFGRAGGQRFLHAQLDNQGTIEVSDGLTIDKPSAAHTNSGTINVIFDLTVVQSGTSPSFINTGTIMGLAAAAALNLLVHRADAAVSLVVTPDGDGLGAVAAWGSGAFPHTGPNLSESWQGPDGTTFTFASGVFSEFFGDFYNAHVQGNVAGSGLHDLLFFGGEPNTGMGNLKFGPNDSYDLSYSYENLGTGAAPVWSGEYTLRTVVPEPSASTMAMVGLSLIVLLMARRRCKPRSNIAALVG